MMLQDEPILASEIQEQRRLDALYRESERDGVTQQLGPESKAQWYLIRCHPGRDMTAMRWLSRRRFGVFLPMTGLKRVLPGWLCAYVWDMEAMHGRILDCPGVIGVLRCHKELPLIIDMAFVQRLARQAWVGRALPAARPLRKAKRIKPRDRKAFRKAKKAAKRAKLARALDVGVQFMAYRNR